MPALFATVLDSGWYCSGLFSVKLYTTVRSMCKCLRPKSRGLESLTAGLHSLRLASRLKPWLRTIDGLGWLMAASHGLQVQTRKLTTVN